MRTYARAQAPHPPHSASALSKSPNRPLLWPPSPGGRSIACRAAHATLSVLDGTPQRRARGSCVIVPACTLLRALACPWPACAGRAWLGVNRRGGSDVGRAPRCAGIVAGQLGCKCGPYEHGARGDAGAAASGLLCSQGLESVDRLACRNLICLCV